jgi:hypothetical protein
MDQLATRVSMAAAATIAIAALAGPHPAHARPASAGKAASSVKLCGMLGSSQLAAVHITAPCVKGRTTRKTTRTSLGPVTRESFVANWGKLNRNGTGHFLVVGATRFSGSAAALFAGRARLKANIRAYGIKVGAGSLAAARMGTSSCLNPPTEDCTHTSVLALVRNFVFEVIVYDEPVGGVAEAESSGDRAVDVEQEEVDGVPTVSIAKTVGAKL